MSHLQQACLSPSSEDTSETEHLQKQLNSEVSSQTSRHKIKLPQKTIKDLLAPSEANTKQNNGKPAKQPSSSHKPNSEPRHWCCFQCSEDGHITATCEGESNPSLVAAKDKQLRERQLQWAAQNSSSETEQLN
jgi:hypothetical protein